MSARSRTIPDDVKTRIDPDSRWMRYPKIFGGVGLASLLIAFVISTAGHDPHASHDGGPAEKAQHQESSHGESHGESSGEVTGSGDAEHGEAHGEDAHADEGDGHEAAAEGHGDGAEGHAASAGDHGEDAQSHGASADGHGEDGEGHGGGHHDMGPRFWFSYLTAYMYGLSLALGGLFFVIIQFLVRAGWSVVVRRIAENVMGTLPLFAILFIPVAFGLQYTHGHWWNYEPGTDAILDGKLGYLNKGFFFLRAIVYLAVWVGLARVFLRTSVQQDESGDHEITRKLQKYSPVALILFALTLTFAAIDWMKSMDPHWYSTMWGVYYFAGCVVGIFATLAILVLWLQRDGYVRKVINTEHYHDIGKLLFGFVVFWTYIAFSQYFLQWYANIPEEQLWFYHRAHGGWDTVGKVIVVGHFFIPFFFLLPRAIKRNPKTLLLGAAWMLVIHYVDLFFVVMPVYTDHFSFTVVDLLTLVGVVGLFLAAFTYLAARSELIPRKDPRLPESLGFENI
jgi:hypothetical protein